MTRDLAIESRDASLFAILTALSDADKRSFLEVLNVVRDFDRQFTYLEVGSDLGGSLIVPLLDSRCRRAISIDVRTASQPDERGRSFAFPGNSTQRMIEGLRSAGVGAESLCKLLTFDADASTVTLPMVGDRARLAFIDAEHTNRAVFRDFLSIRRLMHRDAVVAFHDSNLVFDALLNIEEMLAHEGANATAIYLPDTLFVLAFGALADLAGRALGDRRLDRERFVAQSRRTLNDEMRRSTA